MQFMKHVSVFKDGMPLANPPQQPDQMRMPHVAMPKEYLSENALYDNPSYCAFHDEKAYSDSVSQEHSRFVQKFFEETQYFRNVT